jgi:hypothetical protein
MKNLYNNIATLYLKDKLSVKQIADLLSITSSKVRYHLDNKQVKRRNRSEAIKYLNLTKFKKEQFVLKNKLNVKDEKLKIAGVMIYWGEGTKKGNTVTLSNSNPKIILLFLKFLRNICGVSDKRLRALIHRYPDQNENNLLNYWSSITGIPKFQFCKSFLHNKASRGTYKNLVEYGTLSLRYSDKFLLEVINSWINDYYNKL